MRIARSDVGPLDNVRTRSIGLEISDGRLKGDAELAATELLQLAGFFLFFLKASDYETRRCESDLTLCLRDKQKPTRRSLISSCRMRSEMAALLMESMSVSFPFR